MSDRIPYYNREDALERYCTCPYKRVTTPGDHTLTREINGVIWERTSISDDCPLHSPDAKYDLPEGI